MNIHFRKWLSICFMPVYVVLEIKPRTSLHVRQSAPPAELQLHGSYLWGSWGQAHGAGHSCTHCRHSESLCWVKEPTLLGRDHHVSVILKKTRIGKKKYIQYPRATALRCNTSQDGLGFAAVSRELNFGDYSNGRLLLFHALCLIAKLPPCSTGHHRPQDKGAPLRVPLISRCGEGHPQPSHALLLIGLGGLTPDLGSH